MKKLSSKIIISLALALFLFVGVCFGVEKAGALTIPGKAETAIIQADCAARFPNDQVLGHKCFRDYVNDPTRNGDLYCYNTYSPSNGNGNGNLAKYNACSASLYNALDADSQTTKAQNYCKSLYAKDLARSPKIVADNSLAACMAQADSAQSLNAQASTFNAVTDAKRACDDANRKKPDPVVYKSCLDKAINAQPESWYDWLKQGIGLLSEGALKVVLAVIGGILQLVFIPTLSALVTISAKCLDIAIKFTLDTGNITQANGAVVATWVMVRNIFNITFIFVLLYTAIRTIIGSANANTKKMLANVIIAALLINFSMFIARIAIDFGNMIAVAFYNAAVPSGTASTAIGDILGLGSLLETSKTTSIWSTSFFIVSVIQIITLIAALTTFVYIALLMLVRTVALIFLLATSPLGFVGDILPKLSEYAKLWRETLYGQIMIAPVFLLFFYLIINVGKTLGTTITNMDGIDQTTLDFTAYFKYILIIILLSVATKECKKMSGAIGSAIEGVVKAAVGIVIGAVTGGVAFAGKRFIGGAAERVKNSEWGERQKDKGTLASRLMLKGLDSTSKASFDARNTGGFKKATDFVGDQTGIKVDYNRGIKIKKDGFQGMVERRAKKQENFSKMVTKDMTDVSPDEIATRRKQLEQDQVVTEKSLHEAHNSPMGNTEEEVANRVRVVEKLEKKKKEQQDLLSSEKKISDQIKAEKTEAKKKRLETQAIAEEGGYINAALGANKAAAKQVRKQKGEKTTAQTIKELYEKQQAEQKAAGIVDEDETEKTPTETKPQVEVGPAKTK